MSRARAGWNQGVAAVEFAIIAPALLLMVMSLICFGLYFVYLHELQELASASARASVAGLSQTDRNTLANQFITTAVANSALLQTSDLTVTTATSGTPAIYYAVTLSYNLKDTSIPLFAGLVPQRYSAISRTATVQFGGY